MNEVDGIKWKMAKMDKGKPKKKKNDGKSPLKKTFELFNWKWSPTESIEVSLVVAVKWGKVYVNKGYGSPSLSKTTIFHAILSFFYNSRNS